MGLRSFVALLIGLAMSLAPIGMPAMAAAPASHHQTMMTTDMSMDHCAGKPTPEKPAKTMGKDCCAAMCIGIAIDPGLATAPLAYAGLALRPAGDLFRNGVPLELPTPPPRSA